MENKLRNENSGQETTLKLLYRVQCGASESSLDLSLVLSAAQSLTGESSQLTAEVSRYLKSVRAT